MSSPVQWRIMPNFHDGLGHFLEKPTLFHSPFPKDFSTEHAHINLLSMGQGLPCVTTGH